MEGGSRWEVGGGVEKKKTPTGKGERVWEEKKLLVFSVPTFV
jgi:hypothetical protein